jgi:ParB-like chromosome segregation protein Spo0J
MTHPTIVTTEEQQIPLDKLLSLKETNIPGGALAVRPLNQMHIQQLTESKEPWPAIWVTRLAAYPDHYIVIDGYHRWSAAKLRQETTIKAIERIYKDERAIIDDAFQSNIKHGLKANINTRGDYAYWLHVTFPRFPQEQIAERAGLTQGAVSKAIARRERDLLAGDPRSEENDPRVQIKRAKQSARRFSRETSHFLREVAQFKEEDILNLISTSFQPEDQAMLARIGLLLANTK